MESSSFSLNVRILRSAPSTVVSSPNAVMRGSINAPALSDGYERTSRMSFAIFGSSRESSASRSGTDIETTIGAARPGLIAVMTSFAASGPRRSTASAATRGFSRSRIRAAVWGVLAATSAAVSAGPRSSRKRATSSGCCFRYSLFSARAAPSSSVTVDAAASVFASPDTARSMANGSADDERARPRVHADGHAILGRGIPGRLGPGDTRVVTAHGDDRAGGVHPSLRTFGDLDDHVRGARGHGDRDIARRLRQHETQRGRADVDARVGHLHVAQVDDELTRAGIHFE